MHSEGCPTRAVCSCSVERRLGSRVTAGYCACWLRLEMQAHPSFTLTSLVQIHVPLLSLVLAILVLITGIPALSLLHSASHSLLMWEQTQLFRVGP